jgi:SAM-dependent methyltransferase
MPRTAIKKDDLPAGFGVPDPKRYMNSGELNIIVGLIASVNPITVIEFGCNVGGTAAAILRYASSVKRYIGIDVIQGYRTPLLAQRKEVPMHAGAHAKADPRFALLLRPNGSRDLSLRDLPQCNAVFIDGDHSREGVLNDYALAKGIVQPGGIIVFHDDNGLPAVQVSETLDWIAVHGADIVHVEGTWISFEKV